VAGVLRVLQERCLALADRIGGDKARFAALAKALGESNRKALLLQAELASAREELRAQGEEQAELREECRLKEDCIGEVHRQMEALRRQVTARERGLAELRAELDQQQKLVRLHTSRGLDEDDYSCKKTQLTQFKSMIRETYRELDEFKSKPSRQSTCR
jgi:hypothetical protein